MTTKDALRTRYSDILDEGDDGTVLAVLADLETALPPYLPSAAVYAQLDHASAPAGSWGKRPTPSLVTGWGSLRTRARAALVVGVLAAAGLGTAGLANAAVGVVTTQLFGAPPPPRHPAVWVGSLAIPLQGGCAPHHVSAPVLPPNSLRVAQFQTVPADFSQSVAATFPPCTVSPPPPGAVPAPRQPANLAWENVTVISAVQYVGDAGTVTVTTARATAEGMSRGLYLGNADGLLSDGTPLWVLGHEVRWVKHGLIVNLSGDASIDRLNQLAGDIVVR